MVVDAADGHEAAERRQHDARQGLPYWCEAPSVAQATSRRSTCKAQTLRRGLPGGFWLVLAVTGLLDAILQRADGKVISANIQTSMRQFRSPPSRLPLHACSGEGTPLSASLRGLGRANACAKLKHECRMRAATSTWGLSHSTLQVSPPNPLEQFEKRKPRPGLCRHSHTIILRLI